MPDYYEFLSIFCQNFNGLISEATLHGTYTTILHLDTFCLMDTAWNVSRISADRKLALDESNRQEKAEAWASETADVRKHSSVTGIAAAILECGHQELYIPWPGLMIFWPSNRRKPSNSHLFDWRQCCYWGIFLKCLISEGLLCVRSQYLGFQEDIGRWGLGLQKSRVSAKQRYRTIIGDRQVYRLS